MFLGSESKLSVPWLDVFLEAKLLMGALMAELLATGDADCPSLADTLRRLEALAREVARDSSKPEVFMKAFLSFSFQRDFLVWLIYQIHIDTN